MCRYNDILIYSYIDILIPIYVICSYIYIYIYIDVGISEGMSNVWYIDMLMQGGIGISNTLDSWKYRRIYVYIYKYINIYKYICIYVYTCSISDLGAMFSYLIEARIGLLLLRHWIRTHNGLHKVIAIMGIVSDGELDAFVCRRVTTMCLCQMMDNC